MWISEKKFYDIKGESYRRGYSEANEILRTKHEENSKTLIISTSIGRIYVQDDIISISEMIRTNEIRNDKFILVTLFNGKKQIVFMGQIISIEEI